MTFEAEVVAGLLVVDVLYGAATLDTADREASGIIEAGHDSGLVFERGLYGFEEFVRVVEVDYVDVTVGAANDEKLIPDIHGIDSVLTVECRDRVL